MVRSLNKETKAEVFWPFEKKLGLENDYLRGKERWESRKTKKAVGKRYTGCFR